MQESDKGLTGLQGSLSAPAVTTGSSLSATGHEASAFHSVSYGR